MATGFKTLSPPKQKDATVQRALDHISAQVNPVLRLMPQQIGQLDQSATLLASVTPQNPATTVTGTTTDPVVQSLLSVLVKHGFVVDGTS